MYGCRYKTTSVFSSLIIFFQSTVRENFHSLENNSGDTSDHRSNSPNNNMGNSLRCCLACVLPCGALDLIRIVHLNGYVEEHTGPITAGEVLEANPNHILSKPCAQGMSRRILILSPETELKRGSIYFLIPEASLPEKKKRIAAAAAGVKKSSPSPKTTARVKNASQVTAADVILKDTDVAVSEKKHARRVRRRSRQLSGSWQPHLQSISEEY